VVVEPDAAGDDLSHPVGVLPADLPVGRHVVGPLVEREVVPVVRLPPPLVHRVKADVVRVGYLGVDALQHVVAHALLDLVQAVHQLLVHVPRHLRHRDERAAPLGEAGERRGLEPAPGAVEVCKRRPELQDEEVGVVANH
jgi:hypothetical protein